MGEMPVPDVRVDEDLPPVDCRPEEPFGLFLDRLRTFLAGEGRVLTDVLIEGESPPPERWSSLLGKTLGELGRVRITSATTVEAARATIGRLRAALPALRVEQQRAAVALQAGQRAAGLNAFRLCLEVWEAVQRAVFQVADWLGGAPAGADVPGASRALAEALGGVRAALETDDLAALADALEADLDPLVDRWLKLLDRLEGIEG